MARAFPSVSVSLFLSLFAFGAATGRSQGQGLEGPGIGKATFTAGELFKSYKTIAARDEGWGTNFVSLHKGYLMVVYARDGQKGAGALQFWDFGNPRQPREIHYDNSGKDEFMEQHGTGFASFGGKDYAAFTSQAGIMFWDLSDVMKPKMISKVDFPAPYANGYSHPAFQLFWQYPYVYVAGTSYGLWVVDARDPANPGAPKLIPKAQLGMDGCGYAWAVGNRLVVTTVLTGTASASFLDISEPMNPQLLANHSLEKGSYASIFNGNRIYVTTDSMKLKVFEAASPFHFKKAWSTKVLSQGEYAGEYVYPQDGHVFFCNGDRFFKVDTATREAVGSGELPKVGSEGPDHPASHPQEGHPTPLGNLLFVGDDHGWGSGAVTGPTGSGLVPHAAAPDNQGPVVTMTNPADGDAFQAPTTRVGVTWSDMIDYRSLTAANFTVKKVGAAQAVAGTFSGQQMITNFHPAQNLELDTEYEVTLSGIRDYSQNPMEKTHRFRFRTRAKAAATYSKVPRDSITAVASSTEGLQAAANVLDADVRTVWHSAKDGKLPQTITLTFSQPQVAHKLAYTPGLDGSGRIFAYRVVGSADGVLFNDTLASGRWANNDSVKQVSLPDKRVKAIRLVAVEGQGGYASAATLEVQRLEGAGSPVALRQGGALAPPGNPRLRAAGTARDLRGRLLRDENAGPAMRVPETSPRAPKTAPPPKAGRGG